MGYCLHPYLTAQGVVNALKMALKERSVGDSLIHHSDRGVQYCCDAYVDMLKSHGITISMTEDYKPTDNAIAERFNGILKTECVYPREQLPTFEQAQVFISRFIQFYNHRRPHMSIG